VSPPSRSARSQAGQTLPIVVVFMFVIIGLAGMVIDIGNLERCRAQMQAAADAAAAAGANELMQSQPANPHDGEDTARDYGMSSAGKNQVSGIDTNTVSEQITTGCDTTYSACSLTETGPNTVSVHEDAHVPTFFLGIFGITDIKVSVDAEACGPCGSATEHDIMLVLDHTGSMSGRADSTNGQSKLENLQAALLNGLLPGLSPTLDRVGVTVFPPDTASAPLCTQTNASGLLYDDPTARFLIEPLSGGFIDSGGAPIDSSPVIQTISCLPAAGRTDYVDPLKVATEELEATARPDAQKVIVMISDGAANQVIDSRCPENGPGATPIFDCANPCIVGINQATTAKNDGIEIFAIAYGDLGLTNDTYCHYASGYQDSNSSAAYALPEGDYRELPYLTGYDAMQQIASPGDYYADPDPASLRHLLPEIAGDIVGGDMQSRLVK
jgi:Tfp pilus assembly protein PilX